MTRGQIWLESAWPFVRAALPAAPAEVIEIGCGTAGGFVPFLLQAGYTAVGIDPQAPAGPPYLALEFESYQPPHPVDAIVASTSLHHVADLALALDHLTAALRPSGTAIVIEWASERFDEPTARWCFARIPAPDPNPTPAHHPNPPHQHVPNHQHVPDYQHGPNQEPGHDHQPIPDHEREHAHQHGPDHQHGHQDEQGHSWLFGGRQAWLDSGQPWSEFLASWRAAEGLHTAGAVIAGLNARLRQRSCTDGPYVFPDLDNTTEADEQAAISSGQIQPTSIRYIGTKPPHNPSPTHRHNSTQPDPPA